MTPRTLRTTRAGLGRRPAPAAAVIAGAVLALTAGPASATDYVNIWQYNESSAGRCRAAAETGNDWWGYPRDGSGPYWFYCGGASGKELWVRQPAGGYWG
ncbi:hypothetical protein [Streptomyces sp. NPDC007088]|uniref:hypothetical protein n=1 Tax=Streptomyces sp. NPDC007088 TaxID=3364773 RepID=UPI00369A987F